MSKKQKLRDKQRIKYKQNYPITIQREKWYRCFELMCGVPFSEPVANDGKA